MCRELREGCDRLGAHGCSKVERRVCVTGTCVCVCVCVYVCVCVCMCRKLREGCGRVGAHGCSKVKRERMCNRDVCVQGTERKVRPCSSTQLRQGPEGVCA